MVALRVGMLTPSSNTVLEPVTMELLRGLSDVTAHFARFKVTEIALGDAGKAQFDLKPMLNAAHLLADAKVDVICWNGTSAGWLGPERDRALCEAIRAETGIAATSAVLAVLEAFKLAMVTSYGLVTPYLAAVQLQIIETFGMLGFRCLAERHLDIRENHAFAAVTEERLEEMIRTVAAARPNAVLVLCTNLMAAPLVMRLEEELGLPIFDSVAAALWGSLRAAGAGGVPLQGGRLFQLV